MRYFLFSVVSLGLISLSAQAENKVVKTAPAAPSVISKIETKVAKMMVNCPPKGGVKTYGDGNWSGVDHPNAYPLLSNRVDGQWIGCTYAGPQGFNFDLSPSGGPFKNCKVASKGVFECDKN